MENNMCRTGKRVCSSPICPLCLSQVTITLTFSFFFFLQLCGAITYIQFDVKQWVFTYVHSRHHDLKIINISIRPQNVLTRLYNSRSPHPPAPLPSNHWSTCCYSLHLLDLHGGLIRYRVFLFGLAFTQHNYVHIHLWNCLLTGHSFLWLLSSVPACRCSLFTYWR